MKVQFSREVEYIPTWKGNSEGAESFKVLLSPMEMDDFLSLMDSIQTAGLDKLDQEKSGNVSALKELIKVCGHLIPKYCKIVGLTDESGTEISAADIVKYTYFIELSTEILTALGNNSVPTEEDEKN